MKRWFKKANKEKNTNWIHIIHLKCHPSNQTQTIKTDTVRGSDLTFLNSSCLFACVWYSKLRCPESAIRQSPTHILGYGFVTNTGRCHVVKPCYPSPHQDIFKIPLNMIVLRGEVFQRRGSHEDKRNASRILGRKAQESLSWKPLTHPGTQWKASSMNGSVGTRSSSDTESFSTLLLNLLALFARNTFLLLIRWIYAM